MAWNNINAQSHWTPERDAIAIRMWLAGDSATIIGRELNCSRNAVIGRLHRLKVHRETAAPVRFMTYPAARTKVRTARKSLKAKPAPAKLVPVALNVIAKPFTQLGPRECRYGLDSPEPGHMDRMMCCAAPTPLGEPYCPTCRARCWVPPKNKPQTQPHWFRINNRREAAA